MPLGNRLDEFLEKLYNHYKSNTEYQDIVKFLMEIIPVGTGPPPLPPLPSLPAANHAFDANTQSYHAGPSVHSF